MQSLAKKCGFERRWRWLLLSAAMVVLNAKARKIVAGAGRRNCEAPNELSSAQSPFRELPSSKTSPPLNGLPDDTVRGARWRSAIASGLHRRMGSGSTRMASGRPSRRRRLGAPAPALSLAPQPTATRAAPWAGSTASPGAGRIDTYTQLNSGLRTM